MSDQPPRTPWAAQFERLLADGRWHALDEIVDVAGPLVPPGVAHRKREKRRLQHNPGATPNAPMTDQTIAVGRRDMVRHALDQRVATGRIERRKDDDDAWYRRRAA